MKFLLILLTIISSLSFADSVPSKTSELVPTTLEELSEPIIEPDCLLAATRGPTSCKWSTCVDNCDAGRVACLRSSNSSVCGPRYESCIKNRCKNCK